MVEKGMLERGEGDKLSMESSSAANCQTAPSFNYYPPPLVTYEDVFSSRELFMETLRKLHASMGTKFMIPIVGGRDLDLYRLFVEVTSRGGIAKVVKERKWKDVTAAFSFPSSATNASFILRKYYVSLIYHYEQIYFFKATCWTPSATDAFQYVSSSATPPQGPTEQTHATAVQDTVTPAAPVSEASVELTAGTPVCGVIDGKFEGGYLVTVKFGSEEFKGVLYQVANTEAQTTPSHHNWPLIQKDSVQNKDGSKTKLGAPRRKRRKKSEMRKRDPAHPKPNRSGYNFFFAEQHARLKPLYPGRDREISRMIGELWNKLQDHERTVYQEKAYEDKERYKSEMEVYRERLRTGQVISNMLPIQQHPSIPEAHLICFDSNIDLEGGAKSAYGDDHETSSGDGAKSEKSILGEYDKDSDFGAYSGANIDLKTVDIEILADEGAFELQTGLDKSTGDVAMERKEVFPYGDDGVPVPVEEKEFMPGTSGNE
ncbi:HMG box protein with ARID/BRIGHT DNA-binding domain isoform 1 [Dorcoceras hygrometricum]|uniref:HMG box protein with ARID/BRIGHT DNA-binding domain isoform 1 n=1 Tax=Dorcoceras hygrometricum TaxID=472368 RepID=A0A2Z7AE68_9LAMI|nr:HMG box protein with ARID/BRIGHT DNA-binding domain isoform 1 [Dorcoceras hygrometricum]